MKTTILANTVTAHRAAVEVAAVVAGVVVDRPLLPPANLNARLSVAKVMVAAANARDLKQMVFAVTMNALEKANSTMQTAVSAATDEIGGL